MNKEVEKVINREEKKPTSFSKWWNDNRHKIMRILFFYIWIPMCIAGKVEKKLNVRNGWNDERANEILNYYIPRRAVWDNKKKEFYLFDNGYGWSINFAKKYLKLKDRRFWKVNCNHSGSDLCDYLVEKFELEGFTKEVLEYDFNSMELIFKMNQEKR